MAQAPILNIIAGLYNPYDYESITVSSSAVGFTASKIDNRESSIQSGRGGKLRATRALVTVESDQIRYRLDGTNPTSSEGHLLNAGDVLTVFGYDAIKDFKAIRVSTDATIRVTYER